MARMVRLTGNWDGLNMTLRAINKRMTPHLRAKLYESGELVIDIIKSHMINQDLNWNPLSPETVRRKGSETIYIETGELFNSFEVRKLRSSKNSGSIFVGASPWKTHKESGLKYTDLMLYLEYGTEDIPARPLIAPSFEEAQKLIMEKWKDAIKTVLEVKV